MREADRIEFIYFSLDELDVDGLVKFVWVAAWGSAIGREGLRSLVLPRLAAWPFTEYFSLARRLAS